MTFKPVFEYEQVRLVSEGHNLALRGFIVPAGRDVVIMPKWLVKENMKLLLIKDVRLDQHASYEHINLGLRNEALNTSLAQNFIDFAVSVEQ